MRLNFHESFAQGAIKTPSERSTRLTFVAVTLCALGNAEQTVPKLDYKNRFDLD
jgi:hypothetical protein